jgi:serine/threonine protein kinase
VFEAHRASWRADEPPRALKVFDPIMSSSARAALVSEFDMLRRTRHPNLLHGEDAFDVEDGPFAGCVVFVLELADTDLASELGRRGPLPPAELAVVGAHVASGLAALHAGGHLHGDVKPANLLRVGSTWKLGDFGVSSAVQGSYSVAPGATLDYTPPELSAGPDGYRVHRSADVWALGVTLGRPRPGSTRSPERRRTPGSPRRCAVTGPRPRSTRTWPN